MGNIYKRGKNWYLDLRVNGRRVRKRVGSSKEVAQLALKDIEVQAARREFGFLNEDVPIQRFLAEFEAYSKTNHRDRTTKRYGAVIDHLWEFLKLHPSIVLLSHITPAIIDQYKTFRKQAWVNPNGQKVYEATEIGPYTRRGAKAYTINFEVNVLRTILYVAVKWGYLKDNPTKGITKLKVEESKQPRFLTEAECETLLKACSLRLYPIVFTFLNTGMRKAELENLEWTDIDLKRKRISIRKKSFWQPKTGERHIPINDPLCDLLQRIKAENTKKGKSNFVFCDLDGSQIKYKVREQLIKTAKHAGIPDLTKIHTLRHTFASHLVMKGIDLPTVQKLMGHADIQTTMIYSHLAEDHLSNAVDKLRFDTQPVR